MENLLQTLEKNYIWVLVVLIFILFTVIGYFVDRSQNKKRKAKLEKVKEQEQEKETDETFIIPEKAEDEVYEPIDINEIAKDQKYEDAKTEEEKSEEQEYEEEKTEEYDTKEMSKNFLKEDNYDLSDLLKESINETKEKQAIVSEGEETNVAEAPEVDSVTEKQPETTYDRNLEYLLKEKEESKEEIESIDDFLQRTMREAYHPTDELTKEEKVESDNNDIASDIDYEDTLPIPIQNEQEFSPLEVTVVDPEFYKEYASKPKLTETSETKEEEPKDVDFKPIEDAILESLGKLSELEESKEDNDNISQQ